MKSFLSKGEIELFLFEVGFCHYDAYRVYEDELT